MCHVGDSKIKLVPWQQHKTYINKVLHICTLLCLHAGLHLIINELHSTATDELESESEGEHAPDETNEASQLLVVDAQTGLNTRLDDEDDNHDHEHPMNAHHTFHCSSGGYLLIGLAQAQPKQMHTQQLLLYKLKAGAEARALLQGTMDLHWQTYTEWQPEKGEPPAYPVCTGKLLAWLVGPRKIAALDLGTQQKIKRLPMTAGPITGLAFSPSGR